MDRRSLLKFLAAAPLLGHLSPELFALSHRAGAKSLTRRVRPGDPGWPSAANWEKLKQQVGGRLIPVQSPLAACRTAFDSTTCEEVRNNLKNPYYLGDQPGITQTLGWVDAWTTQPSIYAVAAMSAEDIAVGVNFARENNLRLVVKGGGHSYQGTSCAPDSLLIWTRHMSDITMHDVFLPQGCRGKIAPQPAVTLGAGAIWMHAYQAVTTNGGKYVQGGGCTTVGVAGLVQSGGFGSFSKHYGTAASGLLEAEVVTADGEIRIANACTNPDLFWALKGGGGGSFGAISRVTLGVRELPEYFGAAIFTVKASSDAAYRRLVAQFVSFYRERLFNDHWGEQAHFEPGNSLGIMMISQGLDTPQTQSLWQPFLDFVAASPHDYTLDRSPILVGVPPRTWWDVEKQPPGVFAHDTRPGAKPSDAWWTGDGFQAGQVLAGYQSQWLPASLLENSAQQRLADALFAGSRHWEIELHFNKGLAGGPADAIAAARETATNPAVCDAFALAIIASGGRRGYPGIPGHEPDVATAHREAGAIDRAMTELRKVAPEPGSYVSESNFFQNDWPQSFWGANYPRLQALKKKYDPDGLFFVHHGVGSEEWSDDGFTRVAG